jgi:hypothetical protein
MTTVAAKPANKLSASTMLALSNQRDAASREGQGSFPAWFAISVIAALISIGGAGLLMISRAIKAKNRRP